MLVYFSHVKQNFSVTSKKKNICSDLVRYTLNDFKFTGKQKLFHGNRNFNYFLLASECFFYLRRPVFTHLYFHLYFHLILLFHQRQRRASNSLSEFEMHICTSECIENRCAAYLCCVALVPRFELRCGMIEIPQKRLNDSEACMWCFVWEVSPATAVDRLGQLTR